MLCCKRESKAFFGVTAATILLEASVCIIIAALLFVDYLHPEELKNATEFMHFFSTVNNETFSYANETATIVWYSVHTGFECSWWLSAVLLLTVVFKRNIYVGSYKYILPAVVSTFFVCTKDVIGFCYFLIYLLDDEDDRQIIALSERDPASFMNVFFVPFWFAKAFIFWIVNVFFFIKLLVSYNYLRETNSRAKEMDNSEFHYNSTNGEASTYLSVDNLSIKNGYISRRPPDNSFDNYGYEREPNPRNQMGEKRQFNISMPQTNGYNGLGPNGKPYFDPNKNTAEAINSANYPHNNNFLYKKPPKDVLDNGKQSKYKQQKQHENHLETVNPLYPVKSQYHYPHPAHIEKNQEFPNLSDNPFENVNRINPLYQGLGRLDKDPEPKPHINTALPPTNPYKIPRAHLNNGPHNKIH